MAFDGNVVDTMSIALGALAGVHRPIRRRFFLGKWHTPGTLCIKDALSGAAIVPFLLMLGYVWNSKLIDNMHADNRFYLGIGGLIGIIAISSEILEQH